MAKRTAPSRGSRPAAPSRRKPPATKKARATGRTPSAARKTSRTRKPAKKKPAATRSARPPARRPASAKRRASVPGTAPVPTRRAAGPARVLDEPADLLIEAPTSFTLDVRHTRTADAIEEVLDLDPNSTMALAAGDREVRPEVAATIGDETPGGDNPTPDQDVVDLIGRSLGIEYADDQELEGGDEIAARDRNRWELDPQSSEDFRERQHTGALRKNPGAASKRTRKRR